MGVKNKTIEYAFPLSTASVASNGARDFTATTIFIPETTSRTFRSVVLECTAYDNGTAASLIAVLMGISLGAVARDDRTVTQTITNSGENQAFVFTRDVTNYFVTNWTGTSMSAGCRLTIGGVSTISCTAKLIITYEYEDSVTTQIKTVRIPIEGNTGSLSTTLTNVGSLANQLPALDTFLPEASKVYRDIFFETYTHSGTTGTTDRALNLRFNGVTTLSATYEGGLATDYPIKRIDKISGSFNTNTAFNIQASTANVDMPFHCLSGILYVTYEFNASTTDTVMNSLFLPIVDEDGYTPSGSANRDVYDKTIYIQEPAPPSAGYVLEQSSVFFSTIDAGAITFDIRVGQQGATTYTHPATVRGGNVFMMRRFDTGAQQDSLYELVRGRNTLRTSYFSTSATAGSQGSNTSAVMILNYKSGKSEQGIGSHNRTTVWNMLDYSATTLATQLIFTGSRTPVIPETYYWITCNGFELKLITQGAAVGTLAASLQAEQLDGEGGPGWINYYSSMYASDNEIGPSWMWNTCKGSFVQSQDDFRTTSGHVLVETAARRYRYDQLTAVSYLQAQKYLTYHSISSSIAVNVTGFTTAGNVTVNVYYSDQSYDFGGSIAGGSPDINGDVTLISNLDNVDIIVTAWENDGGGGILKSGISLPAQPINGTISVNIDEGGGGGGPTYYAYG